MEKVEQLENQTEEQPVEEKVTKFVHPAIAWGILLCELLVIALIALLVVL